MLEHSIEALLLRGAFYTGVLSQVSISSGGRAKVKRRCGNDVKSCAGAKKRRAASITLLLVVSLALAFFMSQQILTRSGHPARFRKHKFIVSSLTRHITCYFEMPSHTPESAARSGSDPAGFRNPGEAGPRSEAVDFLSTWQVRDMPEEEFKNGRQTLFDSAYQMPEAIRERGEKDPELSKDGENISPIFGWIDDEVFQR